MSGTLIGYARCCTGTKDLTAQRDRSGELGSTGQRSCPVHGSTGTNRQRPGPDRTRAAARAEDALVAPELDRLARSVPPARAVGDDPAARGLRDATTRSP
ncbi:recombinase family protein [Nocardia sp. NPDC051900]|uniref:recombinase family protein n=1 Tax=Nocardia sp. NPDC051900 TaxID=3364326 RepID=UPI0037AF5045